MYLIKSKNLYRFLLFFLFFWASIFAVSGQNTAYKVLLNGLYDAEFPVLRPEQIRNLKNYQILDTREREEFEVSHIQGARWVGFETFELNATQDLDKDRPVLVYCTVGARSQEIGKKLKDAGFNQVFNLYGGIIHWSNEGKPLFKSGMLTSRVHTFNRVWSIWLTSGEKVF